MKNIRLKYGIIGAGSLGKILAQKLASYNKLLWIIARKPAKTRILRKVGIQEWLILRSIDEVQELPDIIVIAVSDSSIKDLANQIATKFKNELQNKHIFHLSGIMGIDLLESCKTYGAKVFGMHPYQTFYGDDTSALQSAIWGVEKGYSEIAMIKKIVSDLGGDYEILTKKTLQKKRLYHLSAVAASNLLLVNLEFAKKLCEEAGINPQKFLPPIVEKSVKNFLIYGLSDELPLTGPIARRDEEAIKMHIEALDNMPEFKKIYKNLALSALDLAKLVQKINEKQYNKMLEILQKL